MVTSETSTWDQIWQRISGTPGLSWWATWEAYRITPGIWYSTRTYVEATESHPQSNNTVIASSFCFLMQQKVYPEFLSKMGRTPLLLEGIKAHFSHALSVRMHHGLSTIYLWIPLNKVIAFYFIGPRTDCPCTCHCTSNAISLSSTHLMCDTLPSTLWIHWVMVLTSHMFTCLWIWGNFSCPGHSWIQGWDSQVWA